MESIVSIIHPTASSPCTSDTPPFSDF
jgi:hypothetical protein